MRYLVRQIHRPPARLSNCGCCPSAQLTLPPNRCAVTRQSNTLGRPRGANLGASRQLDEGGREGGSGRRGGGRRQCAGVIVPISTRRPDETGLPLASCCVTVSVRNWVTGTPDHSVTLRASLNVPTGTRMPLAFFSHAW
jgi:hypothetical protein